MNPGVAAFQEAAEASLWPLVEDLVRSHHLAGLAVGVVVDGEVALCRGFGVRNVHTGDPVTPETMFHLASVSKPFVATAILQLAAARGDDSPVLDLDESVVSWLPDFTLADGRAAEITLRHLLSHTSGVPDVVDYEWHRPQLGDNALHDYVLSQSGLKLATTPGSTFAYCNTGFEMLGDVLAAATGQTFEAAMKRLVLDPVGMTRSTFMRADVPPDLAASPHVGVPLAVPDGSYPYTRQHAPSSSLHSNVVELCRWMLANLESAGPLGSEGLLGVWVQEMWTPSAAVGSPPWEEEVGLGWFLGSYRGHRTVGHSGGDPGFGSRIVLMPEQRTGVVVLANSNVAPPGAICMAVLDLVLDLRADVGSIDPPPGDPRDLRALLPAIVDPLAATLAELGPDAAVSEYARLAAADPSEVDVDDGVFEDAVWGAIELHRTELVWPLLRLWTTVRPESSPAWTMTGWANQLDGRPELGAEHLRRALELDPDNKDAAVLLAAGASPSAV